MTGSLSNSSCSTRRRRSGALTDPVLGTEWLLPIDPPVGCARDVDRSLVSGELHDWEYGERQATIDDVFGHQWTLTQTLVDTAPEQWGGKTITPRR